MQRWEKIGNDINMRSKICSNNARDNDVHSSDRMTNDREYNNVFLHHYYHHYNLSFCSTNWDHPLQGVRRQVQRCPLWSHHVWGMQGGHNDQFDQNPIPHQIISRVSSGGLSRVWQITSVPARRTAWWTEWTETGASSAASRSAWRWACPETVSTRAVAST